MIDNGSGLPKENRHRILEPYMTMRDKGTGLGLAISRHFCRLMGGDLTVESVSGEGSTFTVLLPAQVEVPASRV